MQANTATFTAVLVMRCLSDNRRYASGIVALNADAAREVWQAAREEHKTAEAQPPIILEFRIGGLTVCGRVFYISRSQSVSYLINSCWKTPQYCETDPS